MRDVLDDQDISEKSWSETTDDGYRIDVSIYDAMKDRTENLQVKLLEINLIIRWIKDTKERSLTLKAMKVIEKKI